MALTDLPIVVVTWVRRYKVLEHNLSFFKAANLIMRHNLGIDLFAEQKRDYGKTLAEKFERVRSHIVTHKKTPQRKDEGDDIVSLCAAFTELNKDKEYKSKINQLVREVAEPAELGAFSFLRALQLLRTMERFKTQTKKRRPPGRQAHFRTETKG